MMWVQRTDGVNTLYIPCSKICIEKKFLNFSDEETCRKAVYTDEIIWKNYYQSLYGQCLRGNNNRHKAGNIFEHAVFYRCRHRLCLSLNNIKSNFYQWTLTSQIPEKYWKLTGSSRSQEIYFLLGKKIDTSLPTMTKIYQLLRWG